jgi:hypothetical protein
LEIAVRRFGIAALLVLGLFTAFGAFSSSAAYAQICPALHADDYAPVVDRHCGSWILQRMDHLNPRFGARGWQIDDHGKQFILVANYNKSAGKPNFEYMRTLDRALLVDGADLRVGKARPLAEDRVDADLEEAAVGLYLEEAYAESLGLLPH